MNCIYYVLLNVSFTESLQYIILFGVENEIMMLTQYIYNIYTDIYIGMYNFILCRVKKFVIILYVFDCNI